jgi:hypothetical protein
MQTEVAVYLPSDDWKTFRSETLHVALEYPPDWSAHEQAAGATFTPAHGAIIQLALIETGDFSPEEFLNEHQLPNTRCSSSKNAHDVAVRTCLDTLSGNRTAYFVLNPPQGAARLLALTVFRRGDLQVFQAMVASLRPDHL